MNPEKTKKELAHEWVTNNPDGEVRRMYGHYFRAFIAGFDANVKPEGGWIPVSERLPEVGESVAFIVSSANDHFDKKRLGGRYQGKSHGYHAFSVPGIEFEGTHWMPLPEAPTTNP